jgi:hypothetical protein
MTTSDTALLDANILVYIVDQGSPHHAASFALRERGVRGQTKVCVTPQVLCEFFATVTNPKRTARPLTQKEALIEMEQYLSSPVIDTISFQPHTQGFIIDLLKRYPVSGQDIFDLQLVATMLSNGINRVYTFNRSDFEQYKEIEVLSPESVLQ